MTQDQLHDRTLFALGPDINRRTAHSLHYGMKSITRRSSLLTSISRTKTTARRRPWNCKTCPLYASHPTFLCRRPVSTKFIYQLQHGSLFVARRPSQCAISICSKGPVPVPYPTIRCNTIHISCNTDQSGKRVNVSQSVKHKTIVVARRPKLWNMPQYHQSQDVPIWAACTDISRKTIQSEQNVPTSVARRSNLNRKFQHQSQNVPIRAACPNISRKLFQSALEVPTSVARRQDRPVWAAWHYSITASRIPLHQLTAHQLQDIFCMILQLGQSTKNSSVAWQRQKSTHEVEFPLKCFFFFFFFFSVLHWWLTRHIWCMRSMFGGYNTVTFWDKKTSCQSKLTGQ